MCCCEFTISDNTDSKQAVDSLMGYSEDICNKCLVCINVQTSLLGSYVWLLKDF